MTDEEYRLVIGGRTVPGEDGDLSGDQPGPARRGGAGGALGLPRPARPGRRRGPGRPGRVVADGNGERAALVIAAAEAAGRAVESEDLATLLTREHGKVLWEAMFDAGTVGAMAASFAPVAASANEARAREVPGKRTEVRRVPHGVVAALLPFNWPVAVMGNKVVPALLTGNTVVVKAPPTCPGAVLRSVAAMAALLPDGVLNVLNGPHAALGAALVAHPGVDMVSFTGGVPTGRAVMAAAAASTKPVVLELGGNDPAILAPDVVVDEALADKIVGATFVTSGQVCMAIKRLYVPEERTSDVVEALGARLSAEVVGDGLAEGVTMGPVHLESGAARVEAMLEEAEHLGAKVDQAVAGARGGPGRGRLLRPPGARRQPADHGAHRDHGAVRPGPPGGGLPQPRPGASRWPTTPSSASAPRCGATTWSWRRRSPGGSRPARSSSTPTACRPWTRARRWGGGSHRASAWSSGPRACGPSPAPRCCSTHPGPRQKG